MRPNIAQRGGGAPPCRPSPLATTANGLKDGDSDVDEMSDSDNDADDEVEPPKPGNEGASILGSLNIR